MVMIQLMNIIIIAVLLVLHTCYSQLLLLVCKYTINDALQSLVSMEKMCFLT